jgi:hypothetical protein
MIASVGMKLDCLTMEAMLAGNRVGCKAKRPGPLLPPDRALLDDMGWLARDRGIMRYRNSGVVLFWAWTLPNADRLDKGEGRI